MYRFSDIRQKHFLLTSTRDLFDNIDVCNIIAVVKETSFLLSIIMLLSSFILR